MQRIRFGLDILDQSENTVIYILLAVSKIAYENQPSISFGSVFLSVAECAPSVSVLNECKNNCPVITYFFSAFPRESSQTVKLVHKAG